MLVKVYEERIKPITRTVLKVGGLLKFEESVKKYFSQVAWPAQSMGPSFVHG